jgi:hypothetical protein
MLYNVCYAFTSLFGYRQATDCHVCRSLLRCTAVSRRQTEHLTVVTVANFTCPFPDRTQTQSDSLSNVQFVRLYYVYSTFITDVCGVGHLPCNRLRVFSRRRLERLAERRPSTACIRIPPCSQYATSLRRRCGRCFGYARGAPTNVRLPSVDSFTDYARSVDIR